VQLWNGAPREHALGYPGRLVEIEAVGFTRSQQSAD
jgi:hypothetical protein